MRTEEEAKKNQMAEAEAKAREETEAQAKEREEAEANAKAKEEAEKETRSKEETEKDAKERAESEKREEAKREAIERKRIEESERRRADKVESKKARREEMEGAITRQPALESTEPVNVILDSASEEDSQDEQPISTILQRRTQRTSGTTAETTPTINIQQPEGHGKRVKQVAKKPPRTPKRSEPEGKTPADDKAKKARKGKSRVDEITEQMETLKPKPPKYFTDAMREFPERVHSYLYSQGREGYNYFAMFPVIRTPEEVKYIEKVMRKPESIFSASPIRGIPDVKVTHSKYNILNVKFKVTREDGSEMGFSDVDLHNLCCYDLLDLYGAMYNQEGKDMKYSIAKLKVLGAIKNCVRMYARRDFELALTLGLEQTDLDRPDEELYDLIVTEVYIPVPEAEGMSFLNEDGEIRIYRTANSMKYSNSTLIFLYDELINAKRKLTSEQIRTKENLITSFQAQLNFRKYINRMVSLLRSLPDESRVLDRFLAEKPIF